MPPLALACERAAASTACRRGETGWGPFRRRRSGGSGRRSDENGSTPLPLGRRTSPPLATGSAPVANRTTARRPHRYSWPGSDTRAAWSFQECRVRVTGRWKTGRCGTDGKLFKDCVPVCPEPLALPDRPPFELGTCAMMLFDGVLEDCARVWLLTGGSIFASHTQPSSTVPSPDANKALFQAASWFFRRPARPAACLFVISVIVIFSALLC